MDTLTINRLLKNSKIFVGTFARDMIPYTITKRPLAFIANTDPSGKPGQHWIAICLNSDGSGEYFDSYGLPPLHNSFIKNLDYMCPLVWGYNPITLQCLSCITCGHYCVLFVKLRSLGYTFCDFISLFSKDLYQNELLIKRLVKF